MGTRTSSTVTNIWEWAFNKYLSLEIVHLPAMVSNIEINSFIGCDNLKAIHVPENNVDYYKERFPSDMHWLIDVSFAPILRVIVPKAYGAEDQV
jgi:hypothetical protein